MNVFEIFRSWLWRKSPTPFNKINVNATSFDKDRGVVQVGVEKKYDDSTAQRIISDDRYSFSKKDLVPKTVRWKGLKKYPTEVVEIGELKPHGIEIQPDGESWVGTGGALAVRKRIKTRTGVEITPKFSKWLKTYFPAVLDDSEDVYYLVTNRHVAPRVGMKIRSPYGGEIIGEVVKVGTWKHDCSLIKLEKNVSLDRLQEIIDAKVGYPAEKTGRTTGRTSGECVMTGTRTNVNHDGTIRTHTDCDLYKKDGKSISAPGDSGSMIKFFGENKGMTVLAFGSNWVTGGSSAEIIYDELEVGP